MALLKKPSLIILAVIILVIAIVLGSFVYLYLNTQRSSSSELQNLTFGDIGSDPLGALVHVAKDQNLFADNGINMTIVNTVTGPNTISAVLNGQVNFGTSLEYAFVANSVLKTGNLSIVSSIDRSNVIFLCARTDKGVYNVTDLTGKKIGLSLQQSSLFYLARFLNLNGMNVTNVTLVDLPPAQWVNALVNGTVDAIVAGKSYIQQAENELSSNTIVFSVQSDQLSYSLVFCRNDWIAQHPQLVKQFLVALTQAQEYVASHPSETKVMIEKEYNATEAYVNQIWSDHQFGVSLDQSLLLAMQDEVRWLIENNLTNATSAPNFLNYIYFEGLETVKPNSVTIIH
jgi:ABC-type nitrate/sulfonate/bicarbonate transport system substrate-binding protein